jgi:hypothetical protein
MKAYGVDVQIHIFLTSAPVGGDWSVALPGRFTPGIGGWVDPREKIPARSQSLYRLRYPGSIYVRGRVSKQVTNGYKP